MVTISEPHVKQYDLKRLDTGEMILVNVSWSQVQAVRKAFKQVGVRVRWYTSEQRS